MRVCDVDKKDLIGLHVKSPTMNVWGTIIRGRYNWLQIRWNSGDIGYISDRSDCEVKIPKHLKLKLILK